MATATIRRKTKNKLLNKLKSKEVNKSFDFILLVTVLILLGMGIVMVLSASSPSALATTGSSYTFVSRQAISAILGVAAMLVISRIDYKQYPKFYKAVFAISVIVLLLVLVPGLRKSNKWSEEMDILAWIGFVSTIRNNKSRDNSILRSTSFNT